MPEYCLSNREMRVLLVHTYYQQLGGEDRIFDAECRLLEDNGHEVIRYIRRNDDITGMGKLRVAQATFWNRDTYAEIRNLIRKHRPDVLHAHNTFPLISPSAYAAARAEGVPVVQTLHNYRLLCANGMLFRAGAVCELCVGRKLPWPAVSNRCYRGGAVASLIAAGMVAYHRRRGTWTNLVDLYLAPTEFAKEKFVMGGLPADRIVVKPNFVYDPYLALGAREEGQFFLFVGRLSREKGIATMLAAWRSCPSLPALQIIGDGPMRLEVEAAVKSDPRISWLGFQGPEEIHSAMRLAFCLVFPSVWYEGAPRVIVEAYAAGLPVIGSSLGASGIQVELGVTGLHHTAGDAADLARKVEWAWQDRSEMRAMGQRARQRYLTAYSPSVNYKLLKEIYTQVRSRHSIEPSYSGHS
jgi:glycosyltransferase involved in cell wall biosynthesis